MFHQRSLEQASSSAVGVWTVARLRDQATAGERQQSSSPGAGRIESGQEATYVREGHLLASAPPVAEQRKLVILQGLANFRLLVSSLGYWHWPA